MSPFEVPNLDQMSVEEMIDSVGIWYHEIELQGHKTPGCWNMADVVEHYCLPDLTGLDVIDVGASNGFFSFLFERRGAARVVATELANFREHDYPRWFRDRELKRRTAAEIAALEWDQLYGGMTVAHRLLDSKVERLRTTVYDLPANCADRFDLAFCSNVLIHLRDPVDAMESIREVLRPGGRAIFATPIEAGLPGASAAGFVGEASECAWWVPTPTGLVRMCETAGFANVRFVGSFGLVRTRDTEMVVEIGVVHCERALDTD